jgi:solute:Na+ symporter, SSS family
VAAFKAAMKPNQLNMVQSIWNPASGHLNPYSWLAVILGYPILGIWYWCSDQTHVQRVLGAKNERNAQNGALFAGFLKLLPVFLMVFPGTVGWIMYQKGCFQLGSDPARPDYNLLLAQMINILVPMGLKGLLAAGMVAALMSCMAAALNSCATLISVDIVQRLRPNMADTRVVTIGRITTGIIMLLAMAWSTQGDQFGTIFEAINKIPMVFAPAVTTVFVFGLLWKRGTIRAAMTTFAVGCSIGIVYFIVDLPGVGRNLFGRTQEGFCGLVTDPVYGLGIPFMLAGPMLCGLCILTYVAVSLCTEAPPREVVEKVCWDHPLAFLRGRIHGLGDPRVITALLLATLITLYAVNRYISS